MGYKERPTSNVLYLIPLFVTNSECLIVWGIVIQRSSSLEGGQGGWGTRVVRETAVHGEGDREKRGREVLPISSSPTPPCAAFSLPTHNMRLGLQGWKELRHSVFQMDGTLTPLRMQMSTAHTSVCPSPRRAMGRPPLSSAKKTALKSKVCAKRLVHNVILPNLEMHTNEKKQSNK